MHDIIRQTVADTGYDVTDPRQRRAYERACQPRQRIATPRAYARACARRCGGGGDQEPCLGWDGSSIDSDAWMISVGHNHRPPRLWVAVPTAPGERPAFGTLAHFAEWYYAAVERPGRPGSPYHPDRRALVRAYWAHVPARWVRAFRGLMPVLPARLSRRGWRQLAWALRAVRRVSARHWGGPEFSAWNVARLSLKAWARLGRLPAEYQRFALARPGVRGKAVSRIRDLNWPLVSEYQRAQLGSDPAERAAWTEVAEWRAPTTARAAELYRAHFEFQRPEVVAADGTRHPPRDLGIDWSAAAE